MVFSNTPLPPLILSLAIIAAAISPASAYRSVVKTPSTTPSPSPAPAPAPSFEGPYSYDVVPMDFQEMDNQYLTADMAAAVKKVELFVANDLGSKLKEGEEGGYDKHCLVLCKEMYENAAESMKRGAESVSSGDFIKAAFDVSAFNIDVDACSDCSDAFSEFDQWAKGVAGDCLDKIIKRTISPF